MRLQGFNFIAVNALSGPDRLGNHGDADIFLIVTHHPVGGSKANSPGAHRGGKRPEVMASYR